MNIFQNKKLNRVSIGFIEAVALIAISSAVFLIFGTFSFNNERERLWKELRDGLSVNTEQLVSGLALPIWNLDEAQIIKVLESGMKEPSLYSVSLELQGKSFSLIRDENWQVIMGKSSLLSESNLISEGKSVVFSGEEVGKISVTASARFVEGRLKSIATNSALAALIFDVLLIVGLSLVNWAIVIKPLRLIERNALAISTGQNQVFALKRFPFKGELESLWSSIERMVSLLESRYLELKKAKEAAENANRLKTEFLNIAAHELRTPLTPLTLALEKTRRDIQKGVPVAQSTLDIMNRQVKRLTVLVNDLLDVTRLEKDGLTLSLEKTDLNEMILLFLEEYRQTPGRRTLIYQEPSESALVEVDREKVFQVLSNFVDNAIKYSPEDKPIEIKIEHPSTAWVRVSVVDHGSGISCEEQKLLFERFVRLPSDAMLKHPGLGLGLYICRKILELHKGKVGVISEKGQGSAFYFEVNKNPANGGE